jgi:hypothetical protein
MAVSGMGGALMKFLGLTRWISENSLGRGGRRFLDVLVSRWAKAPILWHVWVLQKQILLVFAIF